MLQKVFKTRPQGPVDNGSFWSLLEDLFEIASGAQETVRPKAVKIVVLQSMDAVMFVDLEDVVQEKTCTEEIEKQQ